MHQTSRPARPARFSAARAAGWLAAASLVGAALLGPAAATSLAGSGSIWTTAATCSAPAPQDQNHYTVGDTVYVRGANFDPTSPIDWTITGQPNSGDPNAVVASGTVATDDAGAFCVEAYTVSQGDSGEYKVTAGGKHDNYGVDGTGDTGGSTATGTPEPSPSLAPNPSPSSSTGDDNGSTASASPTASGDPGSDASPTASSDPGSGSGNSDTSGSNGDEHSGPSGGAQGGSNQAPVVVGAPVPTADPIMTPAPIASLILVPAPTGAVEGVLATPKVTLPPTDTLTTNTSTPSQDQTWRIVLVAFALILVSLLMLPDRRRSSSLG